MGYCDFRLFMNTALINSATCYRYETTLDILTENMVWKLLIYKKDRKYKQNFNSTTDSRHFKIKIYVLYCKH